jgi:hypothetical protein
MYRRTPVFRAIDPAIFGSGLEEDMHLLQKALWEKSENVTFYNGRVRRRFGPQEMFPAGANAVRGLGQMQDSDGVRWVWAASGGTVKRWYGPAAETVLSGDVVLENATVNAPATQWDFTSFGNWMVINNGSGPLRIFKPGTGLGVLGNAPSNVVKVMKKFNYLLAIGYGSAKTRVGWSDADNIDEWTASATNLAGSLSIEELNTPIRAAEPLGASIAIAAEDQLALLSYTGAPFYFGQKLVLDTIGACGKMAMTSDGRNLFGFGRGGFWWSDGVSARYIDDAKMQVYFQDTVNWAQCSKIVVARNDYTSCIEISFPAVGSLVNNKGWSFDPRNASWSPITPFSAKMDRRLFERPIVGSNAGSVALDMIDGQANLPLQLTTKPLLKQLQEASGISDIHYNTRVDEVDLLIKEAQAVEFRVGAKQGLSDDWVYTGWIPVQSGAISYQMPEGFPDGVYHQLDFRSTANDWRFDFQGFVLFGNIEGSKRGTS